ncbi:GGDEF domain-containing protein [Alteromonas ponticola]|uniref:diguanylate cyclase n=1 Tax=Alteromonas aquimaris TaxID=2998417 RepID=A0ABT3P9M5_9ALTE|nr:GGDEF domain-containing protein [Alteromonas aquimaris]MCW8109483.1 GGDEF domain-containing protein [Alteromonas aquimaris]
MSSFQLHIFQISLLGLMTLVGMLFTFMLPMPSQKHKARSAYYARLFLITMWAGQASLSLHYLQLPLVGIVGHAFFITLSAYLLFITVVKRYGHALRIQMLSGIVAHLLAIVILSLTTHLFKLNSMLGDAILLASVATPLVFTFRYIQLQGGVKNPGDRVLIAVVLSALSAILVGAPLYWMWFTPNELQQTLVSFSLYIVMMLTFMLGFAVSIMHSLVSRLKYKIYQDPLTNCKNRHFFYEMAPKLLAHAKRNNEQMSVVICDIDHFKSINDKFGHMAGDRALQQIAKTLSTELRDEDSLIRMGGEEFLILSPKCDLDQAEAFAERLRHSIEAQPLDLSGANISLTASFGVVEIHSDKDIYHGLKAADSAMYKAKSAGRNQVITVNA